MLQNVSKCLGPGLILWHNLTNYLRETGINGVNWIQLAQDRVQWWAFVSTVMNLSRFHKERRLLFDKLSDYQLFKEYPAPWSK